MSNENSFMVDVMQEGARVQKFYDYLRRIFDELNGWQPGDDEEARRRIKQIELMRGVIEEYSNTFDIVIVR